MNFTKLIVFQRKDKVQPKNIVQYSTFHGVAYLKMNITEKTALTHKTIATSMFL